MSVKTALFQGVGDERRLAGDSGDGERGSLIGSRPELAPAVSFPVFLFAAGDCDIRSDEPDTSLRTATSCDYKHSYPPAVGHGRGWWGG